jgi:hypothetical protein
MWQHRTHPHAHVQPYEVHREGGRTSCDRPRRPRAADRRRWCPRRRDRTERAEERGPGGNHPRERQDGPQREQAEREVHQVERHVDPGPKAQASHEHREAEVQQHPGRVASRWAGHLCSRCELMKGREDLISFRAVRRWRKMKTRCKITPANRRKQAAVRHAPRVRAYD